MMDHLVSTDLLALDISSRCTGWAIFNGGQPVNYGTIKVNAKLPMGLRLDKFAEGLTALFQEYHPAAVVIEDIFRGPSAKTFKVLALFHGVAYWLGYQHLQVDPTLLSVLKIRNQLSRIYGRPIKVKEDAFAVIKQEFELPLDFAAGNDIADAIAVGVVFSMGNPPMTKQEKLQKKSNARMAKHTKR